MSTHDWADENARELLGKLCAVASTHPGSGPKVAVIRDFIEDIRRIPGDCVRLPDGRVAKQESIKGGCFFCQDCDAVRCPDDVARHLRRIAEGSGKRKWWSVQHYILELTREVIQRFHGDINSTRAAAEAARGEGGQ